MIEPASHTYRRIFITGASGYVGRNLIRHFTAKGCEVVGLARSQASASIVEGLGASPVIGDICDVGIGKHMTGCDALIHAAADLDHGVPTER